MLIDIKSPERSTAAAAARRELQILQSALSATQPEPALERALDQHRAWLAFLIGRPPEELVGYIAYRLALTRRFGLMPETLQLQEMESCVMTLIRQGEPAHEA